MVPRAFELIEELETQRSAGARLLRWTGDDYVPGGNSINVHDFVGNHGAAGDRGYAVFCEESKLWEVISGLFSQEYRKVV